MPSAASAHSNNGIPPAGVISPRRTISALSVGNNANSHSTIKIAVAEVDQGNEIAGDPSKSGLVKYPNYEIGGHEYPLSAAVGPAPRTRPQAR